MSGAGEGDGVGCPEWTVAGGGGGKGIALPFDMEQPCLIDPQHASKTRRKLLSARAASFVMRDKVRTIPNAVAVLSGGTLGGAETQTLGAHGAESMRTASRLYSRSSATARTSTSSVSLATRRKYSSTRIAPWKFGPDECLNSICGVRSKRMWSMGSVATRSARNSAPNV